MVAGTGGSWLGEVLAWGTLAVSFFWGGRRQPDRLEVPAALEVICNCTCEVPEAHTPECAEPLLAKLATSLLLLATVVVQSVIIVVGVVFNQCCRRQTYRLVGPKGKGRLGQPSLLHQQEQSSS